MQLEHLGHKPAQSLNTHLPCNQKPAPPHGLTSQFRMPGVPSLRYTRLMLRKPFSNSPAPTHFLRDLGLHGCASEPEGVVSRVSGFGSRNGLSSFPPPTSTGLKRERSKQCHRGRTMNYFESWSHCHGAQEVRPSFSSAVREGYYHLLMLHDIRYKGWGQTWVQDTLKMDLATSWIW